MFGKKKSIESEGPYKVEDVVSKRQLQKILNQRHQERHQEGYDVVAVLQSLAGGSNAGRTIVLKLRD